MTFHRKVLTKLGVVKDLSLNVKLNCKPQGGMSKQKIEEINGALRELIGRHLTKWDRKNEREGRIPVPKQPT